MPRDTVPHRTAQRAVPMTGASPPARRTTRQSVHLLVLGLLMLAPGVLVYLTDRDPARAWLMPSLPALAGHLSWGAAGGWLPSAAHTAAFSLFTAAALPARLAWRGGACAAWFFINAAFEAGQHPALRDSLGAALQHPLVPAAWSQALARYFVNGRFDVADIAAAAAGAAAAAAVLWLQAAPTQEHHHAPC